MTRIARTQRVASSPIRGPVRARKSRLASASKKKKKKSPAGALRKKHGAPSELIQWALENVSRHAKVAAWEGTLDPLGDATLYPTNTPFVQSIVGGANQGHTWAEIIHPIDRARVKAFFEKLDQRATSPCVEYRLVDQHGSVVWVRHTVEHVSGQARKRVGRGFVCDIQAEKEFQLESLRVSEREQNRIGQDLHDDLCQVLAGVSCLMRVFEGRVAAKAPEEIEWLKELNQQIVDAMHRTRALTHGLFPGKIQIADIRGALLELASQVKTRFKVDINTQFVGRFPKHSSGQIIQIYRISQEAMSNAIKHGRATQISVRLEAQPSVMELSVTDNGTGFSKTENQAPGVGTNIMKYRANMLGGDVSVIDQAPHGVCVRLRYPFETS